MKTGQISEWTKLGGHWLPEDEHAQHIEKFRGRHPGTGDLLFEAYVWGFECRWCKARDKELWIVSRTHDWGYDDCTVEALLCDKCFVGDALTYEI